MSLAAVYLWLLAYLCAFWLGVAELVRAFA